jgi:hypothetical protein
MTNCLCEKHKDELKNLSLTQLQEQLEIQKTVLAELNTLTEAMFNCPDSTKKLIQEVLPEEGKELDRITDFFKDYASNQQKIIDLLTHEIEARNVTK